MLIGTKLINWMAGFLLFLTCTILLMAFWCLIVFQASITMNKFIISAVLSVFLGVIITFFVTKKFVVVGVGMLGAWTLISVSFLIIPLFGMKNDDSANIIRWSIYIVLGLIGFALGVWKSEPVKIYLTAFIGAFFFVRGISVYAGGFPNELTMLDGHTDIHPAFYGYCAGILVFFLLSAIFQKKFCVTVKDEGDEFEK